MPDRVTATMVRRRWLFGLLMVSGCLWSSYAQILRVHVEVLTGMAGKALARAEAGRRPTPNDLTELLYPLERARQFAHQYRKQAERPSYQAFLELLDGYEALVNEIDIARVSQEDWVALRQRLPAQGLAWQAIATRVMTNLEREG